MSEYAIQLRNIKKKFPLVTANDGIDLNVKKGKIHALLGENGSGKSTLMNILFGLLKPDAGEIIIDGQSVTVDSPLCAIKYGIGMIHQEFMLVNQLTVYENIILGNVEHDKSLNIKKEFEHVAEFSEQFGLRAKLKEHVYRLSMGERQKVEIIKTLYQGVQTIILDEPTSVLTPQEADSMFTILRKLANEDKAVILITHKLDEVLSHSDEVTVLRAGKTIATYLTSQTNKYELAEKMVGREIEFTPYKKQKPCSEEVVRVDNLNLCGDKGRQLLDRISFSLHKGEILGIAGVDGNGQVELSEVLAGMRRPSGGGYFLNQKKIERFNVSDLYHKGVSFIPGERNNFGCANNLSVQQNFILKEFNRPPYSRHGLLRFEHIKRNAIQLMNAFNIKVPNVASKASSLSGGNLQKLILARELAGDPKFLICVQPTRGLDIGAVEYVQKEILKARENGVAILLISTELEELFSLSDRIAVIFEGSFMDILENDGNTDVNRIGLLMAGEKVKTASEYNEVEGIA